MIGRLYSHAAQIGTAGVIKKATCEQYDNQANITTSRLTKSLKDELRQCLLFLENWDIVGSVIFVTKVKLFSSKFWYESANGCGRQSSPQLEWQLIFSRAFFTMWVSL